MVNKTGKQCEFCSATSTPIWRRGPSGKGTLCNACGVKWGLRQRQGQGVAKRRTKKAKTGQLEPLGRSFDERKPPSRAAKSAARQQFLEFEQQQASSDEEIRLSSERSDDVVVSSSDENEMNLLEHLLFVAESKFMKERELQLVRGQLDALKQRVLDEVRDRSQHVALLSQNLASLQAEHARLCQEELTLQKNEVNHLFRRELEGVLKHGGSLDASEVQGLLQRLANGVQSQMQAVEQHIMAGSVRLSEQFERMDFPNLNGALNRSAGASIGELGKLMAVLPQ